MDKNTLLGLLLMGLVIFGFMWLNQPDQQKLQETEQAAAIDRQQKEAAEAERSLAADTLTATERQGAAALVLSAGTVDAETGATEYRTPAVSLSLAKGASEVTGTVEGADTTLSYTEVAYGRFGANVSAENRSRATANLRKALADADRYRGFARHITGDEKLLTLKNDVLSLDISTHGGSIARATLLDYYNYLPKPGTTDDIDTTRVDVWQLNQAGYNFVLTSASQRFDTGSFFFTPKEQTDSTLLMALDLGNGAWWGLRYTLPKGSYVVHMEMVQSGMEAVIPSGVATVEMQWHQHMGRNERGRTFEERNSGIHYKYAGDSPDDISAQGDKSKSLNQRLDWIAFKNQFFSSVMIPRGDFIGAEVTSVDLKDDPTFGRHAGGGQTGRRSPGRRPVPRYSSSASSSFLPLKGVQTRNFSGRARNTSISTMTRTVLSRKPVTSSLIKEAAKMLWDACMNTACMMSWPLPAKPP